MKNSHGKRSYENKETLLKSETCGCYYCTMIFPASDVKNYIKDKNGYTAECPKCGIDSVIPFNKELDKDEEFFKSYLIKCNKISFK